MFELKIALKYLIPQKKALSTSLISLLSIFVISLVVWLVVVFLSVTTGIEKNWLTKLTSLNAPIRITPTQDYFASYYYQVDQISSASNFSHKSIGEKAIAVKTDPYQPEIDLEIPNQLPQSLTYEDGTEVDLVKDLYSVLGKFKDQIPGFSFQDYEISGALMRLNLVRPMMYSQGLSFGDTSSSISQMSFLLTYAENNPQLPSILSSPSIEDLNHLLQTSSESERGWIDHVHVEKVSFQNRNFFPPSFLDPSKTYRAYFSNQAVFIPTDSQKKHLGEEGTLIYKQGWKFKTSKQEEKGFQRLVLPESVTFNVLGKTPQNLDVRYVLQGSMHEKKIPWTNLELIKASPIQTFENVPKILPPWAHTINQKTFVPDREFSSGVLLPASYRKNGVLLGDQGYLSFQAPAGGSTQEHRISIHVTGFYDPGMLPIGNKSLLVPSHITQTLNGLTQIFSPDGTPNNGVFIWHSDLKSAPEVQRKIQAALKEAGLDSFWEVKTFHDYEFSKDLMQQFQSDRLLFTLIAAIILIVACSNIISMLVLLVNDKKKEIATLRAMGAKSRNIALIFGVCGASIGIISSLVGILTAIFTLRHLDVLVSILSAIQGHDAFNTAFFGEVLPNQLSFEALWFVAIVTPVVSILAGLVPALKATKLKASTILRSE